MIATTTTSTTALIASIETSGKAKPLAPPARTITKLLTSLFLCNSQLFWGGKTQPHCIWRLF